MTGKKKSAAVLQHYDAKTKSPTYSLATALQDVKRLLCGALGLLAALCAMLSYGALVEQMDGWTIALPCCMFCCVICTLAAVWLWRQAEGGDGRDE